MRVVSNSEGAVYIGYIAGVIVACEHHKLLDSFASVPGAVPPMNRHILEWMPIQT